MTEEATKTIEAEQTADRTAEAKQTRKRNLKTAEELFDLDQKGINYWLVVPELADVTRCADATIYSKIHSGTLGIPITYCGSSPRFLLSDVMAYLKTVRPRPPRKKTSKTRLRRRVRREEIHEGAQ